MLKWLAIIVLFSSVVNAADLKVGWDANTEPDLAGYKLHYGTVNQIPFTEEIDVLNVTEYTLTGLVENTTYFIAATAYNTSGNESEYSNILEYIVRGERIIIRIIDRPQSIRAIFE